MPRPIVVGLDGSRESLAAVDWAAREALRRGLPLRLLHAYEGLPSGPSGLPELESPRYWSDRIVRGAVDRLGESLPQVPLDSEQVARPPAEALVEAGAGAELLVLGSRAFGGIGGFMAGSVGLATVAHATRPVVLVRAGAGDDADRAVVVGVDATRPCEEVLAFAVESAALRRVPLRVVYTWQQPLALRSSNDAVVAAEQEDAERLLVRALDPWREKFPALDVRALVAEGHPAQELLDASAYASLLVVGRRTRTSPLVPHTGPVAHAVIHHARCPVAVVPHR